MPGLYIHIPFCRQACHYCAFHFSTSLRNKDDLLVALEGELKVRAFLLDGAPLNSLYLGGGTPSILNHAELANILKVAYDNYSFVDHPEITIEANPEDIDPEKLRALKDIGFNRMSLGIQSFDDDDLTFMNRAHDANEAIRALELVAATEFDSYSIDLMFGLVNTTLSKWEGNLSKALTYQIPHLSCYNLTIEEQTAFYNWKKKGKIRLPPDETQNKQFYRASSLLTEAGYDHYEISNYALHGHQSVHNWQYWKRDCYIGIGPSAHSYNGEKRMWNVASNQAYIQNAKNEKWPLEEESLSTSDHLNELIMLGLRTKLGILKDSLTKLPSLIVEKWVSSLSPYLHRGVIVESQEAFVLTAEYRHMADSISSDLFYEE